jgi:hypothetical protein
LTVALTMVSYIIHVYSHKGYIAPTASQNSERERTPFDEASLIACLLATLRVVNFTAHLKPKSIGSSPYHTLSLIDLDKELRAVL